MKLSSPQKVNKTFSNFLLQKNPNKTFSNFIVTQKKLVKLLYTLYKPFDTLNKTPSGETGCLSNIYYLLGAQTSSYLIHFCNLRCTMRRQSYFLWLTGHHAMLNLTSFISYNLCDLRDTMPRQGSPLWISNPIHT